MKIKNGFFLIHKNMAIRIFFIIIAAIALCLPHGASDRCHAGEEKNAPDTFILWALSDIQPKNITHRWHLEKAIEDINKNIPEVYAAVVAGDIVHHRESKEDFLWYLEAKKKSNVPYWFEIAGNHDMKDEKHYREYIGNNLHYSVTVGNILMLFMSDEDRFPAQKISDSTFRWWKNKVEKNRDRIIITITHAYLKESQLFGSLVPSRNISDSERFAEVLKKNRISLWICGHTHLPGFIWERYTNISALKGVTFINVSAIRKSFFNDIESNLVYFYNGKDTAKILRRNHEKGKFVHTLGSAIKLQRPFRWDGGPPKVELD